MMLHPKKNTKKSTTKKGTGDRTDKRLPIGRTHLTGLIDWRRRTRGTKRRRRQGVVRWERLRGLIKGGGGEDHRTVHHHSDGSTDAHRRDHRIVSFDLL